MIETQRSFDELSDALRSLILSGEIPPGEILKPTVLSERFSVSRTPLREAFRLLQREGLLQSESSGRLRVVPLSAEDAEALAVMRISLECAIIRSTAASLAVEDVSELVGLEAQVNHFMASGDVDRFEHPHRAFHGVLLKRAPARLLEMTQQLSDHFERYRRQCVRESSEAMRVRQLEHKEILSAILGGSADAAAGLTGQHYARTAMDVIDALDPEYVPTLLPDVLSSAVSLSNKS